MRVTRVHAAGRWNKPFLPFASGNIYDRDYTSSPRVADQKLARMLANQLNYGNENYSYDGKPAPSFYGYEGTGWGHYSWEYQVGANITNYTMGVWFMPAGSPRQKVRYINSQGETQSETVFNKLGSHFKEVPMPDVTKVPYGDLASTGTDRGVVIFDMGTGEMWDMGPLGGTPGNYTFKGGGWLAKTNASNGIYPLEAEGAWGVHATNLMGTGGLIMAQDMIEVLRGGPIKHALFLGLPATAKPAMLPSVRYDSYTFLPTTIPEGPHKDEVNPAYATPEGLDAIPEAAWFCFPASSRASDFGLTGPFEVAIFEAIRTHGLFIGDTSGACTFEIECPINLGTPYSYAKVNPWAGSSYSFPYIPAKMTDPSLPTLEEVFGGPGSVWKGQPWRELEQIEPFSS